MVYKCYIGLIVLAISLVGFIFIGGCLDLMNGGDQTNAFITYEDTKYEVIIKYPDTWAKLEYPSEEILVTFMPDEDDVLLGEFNVSTWVTYPLDMELFSKRHIDTLFDTLIDFNISSYENPTTLANGEAYTIIFTFRDSGYTFKRLEIWTVGSKRGYMLAYQAEITNYDKYINIVEKMVDYFEITQ